MYLDKLYKDCRKMYENGIETLEAIVDHVDPQKTLDKMIENSLTKVCSNSNINSNYRAVRL